MKKTTFLAREYQADGSFKLVEITKSEWDSIMEENRGQKDEKRRYFVRDVIRESGGEDIMYIEESMERYHEWNSKTTSDSKKKNNRSKYRSYSFDATVADEDDDSMRTSIEKTLSSHDIRIEKVDGEMAYEKLRKELEAWKPWAVDLLEEYERGNWKHCGKKIAQKYNVSPRTVCTYKTKFKKFIKNFFA